jgi:hypothetical protein
MIESRLAAIRAAEPAPGLCPDDVTSYPRPNPETLCFGASLRDPAERPTEPALMEVWWVDGVV